MCTTGNSVRQSCYKIDETQNCSRVIPEECSPLASCKCIWYRISLHSSLKLFLTHSDLSRVKTKVSKEWHVSWKFTSSFEYVQDLENPFIRTVIILKCSSLTKTRGSWRKLPEEVIFSTWDLFSVFAKWRDPKISSMSKNVYQIIAERSPPPAPPGSLLARRVTHTSPI